VLRFAVHLFIEFVNDSASVVGLTKIVQDYSVMVMRQSYLWCMLSSAQFPMIVIVNSSHFFLIYVSAV